MKKWIAGIVILVAWLGSLYLAYGFGGLAGRFTPDRVSTASGSALRVMSWFAGSSGGPCADDPALCGFADTEGRVEVACDAFVGESPDQAVLFVFGQSNSANAGKDRYVAGDEVINFNPHDGRCYRARDPLLGPDGSGGSVWGRLGDALVSEGLYRRVLIAPFGIGGTELVRWTPGGDLHVRVEKTASMLADAGIRPTHVLWHQGESDVVADTPPEEYVAQFQALVTALADLGIDAPVFPAQATHCYFTDEMRVASMASADRIRRAQASLPERIDNVWAGPDTDTIVGPRFRYDGCHFNYQGTDAHARLWLRVLEDWSDAMESPAQPDP